MSVEATQTGSQDFKLMSGPTHQTQPYKPLQSGNNMSRGCLVILQSPLLFQSTIAKSHPNERRRYQTPWFIRNRGMFVVLSKYAKRCYLNLFLHLFAALCLCLSPLYECCDILLNGSTVW